MKYIFYENVQFFLNGLLTMNSQNVRLHNVFVPLRMARIISTVYQLDFRQVQTAIVEHSHLVFAEQRQITGVSFPNYRRRWRSGHVTFDLNIIAHPRWQMVRFQCLIQRNHR